MFYFLKNLRLRKNLRQIRTSIQLLSHAVKNQLMVIKLLVTQVNKPDNFADWEKLTRIRELCEHFLFRLDRLNRIFGETAVKKESTSIHSVLLSAIEKTKPIQANIEFKCDFTGETEERIYMDPSAMEEVFVHFIMNAIEAMPKGGRLEIRLKKGKNRFLVQFLDTGVGIPAKDKDKIFQPFYTTKSINQNWGLGLSFCLLVVHAHHGKITVKSKPGKGSLFTIRLPQ